MGNGCRPSRPVFSLDRRIEQHREEGQALLRSMVLSSDVVDWSAVINTAQELHTQENAWIKRRIQRKALRKRKKYDSVGSFSINLLTYRTQGEEVPGLLELEKNNSSTDMVQTSSGSSSPTWRSRGSTVSNSTEEDFSQSRAGSNDKEKGAIVHAEDFDDKHEGSGTGTAYVQNVIDWRNDSVHEQVNMDALNDSLQAQCGDSDWMVIEDVLHDHARDNECDGDKSVKSQGGNDWYNDLLESQDTQNWNEDDEQVPDESNNGEGNIPDDDGESGLVRALERTEIDTSCTPNQEKSDNMEEDREQVQGINMVTESPKVETEDFVPAQENSAGALDDEDFSPTQENSFDAIRDISKEYTKTDTDIASRNKDIIVLDNVPEILHDKIKESQDELSDADADSMQAQANESMIQQVDSPSCDSKSADALDDSLHVLNRIVSSSQDTEEEFDDASSLDQADTE